MAASWSTRRSAGVAGKVSQGSARAVDTPSLRKGADGWRAGIRKRPFVTSTCIKDNRVPIWPRELTRREAAVKINFAPGLHVAPGQAANVSAYYRWTGRSSRLFVPEVISAADVAPGCRVLDISTGAAAAALMALPTVGASGVVIGADIAPAMRKGRQR